ncbi:MAG: NAD(+)/NADH kinase [Lachnospiraceae bacterium]|nr:NAD(+)/NADH kinase [Lachnospiraceae bacterium]
MKRFCIIANREKDPNGHYVAELTRFLTERECSVWHCDPMIPGEDTALRFADMPEDIECTVVLGGDGTFLHASKALLTKNSAVLGINLGNLGFLTTAEYHDAEEALEKVVRDEYRELYASPLDIDWDERHIEAVAMNEVVVSRNGFSRLIHLQVLVNGEIVSDYQSDGVIISTPIGSTGYSLSAGGPIVQPHAAILLITPICPHTMKARPLAVSDSDVITVRVLRGSRSIPGEAVVSADGDEIGLLDVGQEITIRKGKAFARIISVGKVTFWDRVKSKL